MDRLPVVAAFDFDGTLTDNDSLIPFLCFLNGRLHTYTKMSLELPALASYVLNMISRQAVKERILTRFLKGHSSDCIKEKGKKFAVEFLPCFIKPKGLQRLQWHLDQGHRCVLVSANLDIYLVPWALQAGFSDAITSICDIDEKGLLTGCLKGLNCWGPEKVRQLNQLLGPRENYILYAYGDSRGDKELLESADYAYYGTYPSQPFLG